MKFTVAAAAALIVILFAPASAYALDLRLHPIAQNGFDRASWVAQIGELDATGAAAQGFLLTKDAASANGSAAVVRGLEGVPVRYLTGLAYDYRQDGRCTKVDPRWTLFIEGKSGKSYAVNLGCAVSAASPSATPGWIRRTASESFIRLEVLRKGGSDAFAGTLTGVALALGQTPGSTVVDNVQVATRLGSRVWTSAADNGQDPAGTDAFGSDQLALLAQPFSLDELTYVDDLLAAATAEEWAAIQEDAAVAAG
jgi:hypothetical protein